MRQTWEMNKMSCARLNDMTIVVYIQFEFIEVSSKLSNIILKELFRSKKHYTIDER